MQGPTGGQLFVVSLKGTEANTVQCLYQWVGWQDGVHSQQVHRQKGTALGQVYLIFWRAHHPQRDLNRLDKWTGWKGTSWSSAKANGKFCIWNGITSAAVQVGGNKTESNFQEKDLWTANQCYTLAGRKTNHILSYTSKNEVRKSMEGIFSLYLAPESAHLEYFAQFWPLQ